MTASKLQRADLTDRQRLTYGFLLDYLDHYSRPPTLREISLGVGVQSVTSAKKLLAALEKKGYVEIEPGRARGIRILKSEQDENHWDERVQTLDLLEADRSGSTSEFSSSRTKIQVDVQFLRGIPEPGSCFLVRAGDFGMVPDGVLRGDLVIVEPLGIERLQPGSLVVYQSAGEFLVRRFQERGVSRMLIASDRTFAMIDLGSRATSARIMGRVVGIMRRL